MAMRCKTLLCLIALLAGFSSCRAQLSPDEEILMDILRRNKLGHWQAESRIDSLASYFLGKPYVAATLESEDGVERLCINLREVDCLTLVENVLALDFLLDEQEKSRNTDRQCLQRFPQWIERLRYRDGRMDGYCSRLHYTSDWILENERKGLLQQQTARFSDMLFCPKPNFMSTHPQLYQALRLQPELLPQIEANEQALQGVCFHYIPKEKVAACADRIPSGYVVAITTDSPGLDFAHLGFTCRVDGELHLLHASSTAKKVVVSPQTLSDYLLGIKHVTGIVLLTVKH